MGDYKKHLNLAKEKLESINEAFKEKRYTVVGDLGTKVEAMENLEIVVRFFEERFGEKIG